MLFKILSLARAARKQGSGRIKLPQNGQKVNNEDIIVQSFVFKLELANGISSYYTPLQSTQHHVRVSSFSACS